ncbi:MAG: methyltransferase domain-containing protein [Myxococcales bacterium]|nr:methyltransferase domain-containing protein [Myxococcales bacterium]
MSTIDTSNDDVRAWVKDYYGKVLAQSSDLKTNACCATGAPPEHVRAGLSNVHTRVLERFYGCGFPIPEALSGATVLDLGCGTGRDVYLIAQLVGENGMVHGVDMTDEQLAVARETLPWHMQRFGYGRENVAFHQGYIEDLRALDIADNSVDVVVSNCVVNLSPRKDLVLAEVFRVLKPGGEFYFSDVFCDRRLPADIANDALLHSECLGGAMYDADFMQLAKQSGFVDPRAIESAPITINSAEVQARVGAARFVSTTLRLFKLDGLDAGCEDYGQIATYREVMPEVGRLFALDDHHLFELGRPERVCGNTAAMLGETRFAPYFEITGDRSVHYGAFSCGNTMAADQYGSAARASVGSGGSTSGGGGGGGCC